jgi:membrane-anchored protein YejM (alkaline phosphatase superfamily)
MATQPDTQQAEAEPNSTIIYPTVPKHEEDPAARVNVMKAMMDTIREMALNPYHIPAPASQSVNSRPKRKVLARKTINSSLY